MVIAFFLIGVVFLVAAVRGTQADLFAVMKNDFTGTDNFIVWMAALLAIGAIGYYRPLRPISTAFLGLVIVVMILAQSKNGSGGFFEMLAKQIEETQQTSGSVTGSNSSASAASTSSPVTDLSTASGVADAIDNANNPLSSMLKTLDSWTSGL